MSDFSTPIDIANRACQHMGVRRLDPTLGFNDDTVQAAEIADCYDKLRLSELRRNVWRTSTRLAVLRPIDEDTMFLQPEVWSSNTTYNPGAIVSTVDGQLWISVAKNNLNNPPGGSSLWDGYFGTLTCNPFDSTLGYLAGDVVYKAANNGTYVVYLSLVNSNNEDPAVPETWTATKPDGSVKYYSLSQVVSYNSVLYQSMIPVNGGNVPGTDPATWAVGTTYAMGAQVTGSDNSIYQSLVNGNVGNDPTTDSGANWVATGGLSAWTTTITNSTGSLQWAVLNVALDSVVFAYPIGAGPVSQGGTKNIYRLPAGYLRMAPQDPKAALAPFLGAPVWNIMEDWVFDGDFIVTNNVQPMVIRFCADIRNVAEMDPMFCEGLGARIALECCERVTQSTSKIQTIGAAYSKFMGDARTVNSIEMGPVDAPQDDYISVRY